METCRWSRPGAAGTGLSPIRLRRLDARARRPDLRGEARPAAGAARGGAALRARGGAQAARPGKADSSRAGGEAPRPRLLPGAGHLRPSPHVRVRDAEEPAVG